MKTLIAEDDFTSRLLMSELLKGYGSCHIAVNGHEAVTAAETARATGDPYDLICLDIMMPEIDGRAALKQIRSREEAAGITSPTGWSKIIMTTALDDAKTVLASFHDLCDAYLVKPIEKAKLLKTLRSLGLIA